MIDILIVEDHAMVADAFANALDQEDDLQVVGQASTVAEAAALAASVQPDVVLMDFRLPDGDGADGTEQVRRAHPGARVLVVTSATDDRSLSRALAARCDGYLLKDQPVEELVEAVRQVHEGETPFAPSLVGRVVARLSGGTRDRLSGREVDVLQLFADGRSTAEVAGDLNVSVNTVRNHAQRALMKLGAHSRLEAVAMAIKEGYIQAPG